MKATFKGQINKETEKAIEVLIIGDKSTLSTWIPKSALNMKEMPVDCLSNKETQIFHIHQWFLDYRVKEEKTETESINEADGYETRTLSKDTETVMMPHNPDKIESEFIFYPEFDQPKLRQMHTIETDKATINHIEMVIMLKRLINVTVRVGDLLEAMMEK